MYGMISRYVCTYIHTYKVISHTWMSRVMCLWDDSTECLHTYLRMSNVVHINESCHIYESGIHSKSANDVWVDMRGCVGWCVWRWRLRRWAYERGVQSRLKTRKRWRLRKDLTPSSQTSSHSEEWDGIHSKFSRRKWRLIWGGYD